MVTCNGNGPTAISDHSRVLEDSCQPSSTRCQGSRSKRLQNHSRFNYLHELSHESHRQSSRLTLLRSFLSNPHFCTKSFDRSSSTEADRAVPAPVETKLTILNCNLYNLRKQLPSFNTQEENSPRFRSPSISASYSHLCSILSTYSQLVNQLRRKYLEYNNGLQ